jgi:hypothetical protein
MRFLLFGLGTIFAFAAAFFGYYSVRLLYINVMGVVGPQKQSGMYIGAVAFPLAVIVFSWLSLRCTRAASAKSRVVH